MSAPVAVLPSVTSPVRARSMQNTRTMREDKDAIRILLIRPWTAPLGPLRIALERAGMTARFHRVDIEPALNAALHRGGYDVVVLDPKTTAISLAVVEACMKANRRPLPIVTLSDPTTIADAIRSALRSRLN